ncbi:MAG: DNA mismatch repair endonuclease MutL [Chthoniobacterales bacterium]
MGVIQRLPDEVASQVAAGEVVERPASIVKELMENSLDAEATRVDVEYHRGGSGFLAVTDDGRGMDRDDAQLCLERHATSKIRTGLDLEKVLTFGFRGEALPSVASVSRFRLCTRPHDAEAGTEVVVIGGKIESVRDSGEAPGTRIEVRSLFFNLPARKKFLRGERTEAAHIDHQFQTLAMTHPGRRFSLQRDGRQIHLLAPAATLEDRVRDLLGREFASGLFPLEPVELNGIRLHGLLGRPGTARGDRSGQTLFMNHRAIVSPVISQPLRDAYGSGLPRGMHPSAILFLSIDPSLVDCNVHPAKREVRFQDSISVRETVLEVVRNALSQFRSRPLVVSTPSGPPPAEKPTQFPEQGVGILPTPRPTPSALPPSLAVPLKPTAPSWDTTPPVFSHHVEPTEALPGTLAQPDAFRFIGQLGERYAVLEELTSGLVLLDNRAARERIVFETLLNHMHARQSESQRLLLPAIVALAPRDFEWVCENAKLLALAGVLVEPFGPGSVKVDGVPPVLADVAIPELLLRIADDCRMGGKSARSRAVEETIAKTLSRSASLPATPRNPTELDQLLNALLSCDLPYACPNGHPTMIHFSFSELDRKFGSGR